MCIIVGFDRDCGLGQDRSLVIAAGYEVSGAAADRVAVGDHRGMNPLAVHPLAAERGQEAGMDIDHAASEIRRWIPIAQPPAHGHKAGAVVAQGGADGVGFGGHHHRMAEALSAGDAAQSGTAGDDHRDARRDTPVGAGGGEVLVG